MRSWENRPDTEVWDEPFYAFYLRKTGIAHPGREEILAQHEADPHVVARHLLADRPPSAGTGPPPAIYYQKHMAHHLFEEAGRDWWPHLTHCFLIRQPREMLRSLSAKLETFSLAETGLPQQSELFRTMRALTGATPPVVDSADLLRNPRGILARLCHTLGVPFLDAMLAWPTGPRLSDGVWAPHWYENVWRSTGFQSPRPAGGELPEHLCSLEAECLPHYEELYAHRLTAED